jgi:hypothetical protein
MSLTPENSSAGGTEQDLRENVRYYRAPPPDRKGVNGCPTRPPQARREIAGLKPPEPADEPFNSDMGALLPIALWGRTSL